MLIRKFILIIVAPCSFFLIVVLMRKKDLPFTIVHGRVGNEFSKTIVMNSYV